MTLQQLEYIVAVDKYRHFAKAAEACYVTQSTLSSMVQKLENELDVQIFDRNSHPIKPTIVGEEIIKQAKVVIYNSLQLKEIVESQKETESGEIRLSVIPTVAPYIIPALFKKINDNFSAVQLNVSEARTSVIVQRLERAEIDVALLATPLNNPNLLEIPIYYEAFVAYISPMESLYSQQNIESDKMPSEHLWVLQEGHCMGNQVINICGKTSNFAAKYEAGSIDTLVKIVDTNGGYTIIPELHIPLLSDSQKQNVRKLVNPTPNREISLVVRHDFVKERLLNVLSNAIKSIIPDNMLDLRLKKFAIKLYFK